MHVCNYLKQKVRRLRIEWKIFQGCFKTKKKKKTKRLSFIITQFKIEFLLLFTGCKKVLERMPAFRHIVNINGRCIQVIKT